MVNFKIPKWLSSYITKQDVSDLASKVAHLERNTSVEIASIIVSKSSATGHVFWILLLSFLSGFYGVNNFLNLSGFWQHVGMVSLETALSAGLSIWCGRLFCIQRWLTMGRDLEYQVRLRAVTEFHNRKINETKGRTGVLIFISFMEHRVVILGDQSISHHLPQEIWTEVVNNLVAELKRKNLARGLEKAVERISELVTPIFPAHNTNPNELTNYLIIEGIESTHPSRRT